VVLPLHEEKNATAKVEETTLMKYVSYHI